MSDIVVYRHMNPIVRETCKNLYWEVMTTESAELKKLCDDMDSDFTAGVSFTQEVQYTRLMRAISIFVRLNYHLFLSACSHF